jgi:hypothetical protein
MGMAAHRVQKRIDRELRKPRDLVQKPRARLPRHDGVSDLELPFPQVGFDLLETKFDAVCTENLIRVDAVMESPKLAE